MMLSSSCSCSSNIVPCTNEIWSRLEEDVYLQFLQLLFYEKEAPKKDRHRKINTARGPRDRRMRLSLEVAKSFFHLQDLLGYDKPSATMHWLLTNAAPAIAQLHPTSTTTTTTTNSQHHVVAAPKIKKVVNKKKNKRVAVGRESRIKARERARERTRRRNTHAIPIPIPIPIIHPQHQQYTNYYPPPPSTFFTHQDEQIGEFEFGGNPWGEQVFNTFHLSQ